MNLFNTTNPSGLDVYDKDIFTIHTFWWNYVGSAYNGERDSFIDEENSCLWDSAYSRRFWLIFMFEINGYIFFWDVISVSVYHLVR